MWCSSVQRAQKLEGEKRKTKKEESLVKYKSVDNNVWRPNKNNNIIVVIINITAIVWQLVSHLSGRGCFRCEAAELRRLDTVAGQSAEPAQQHEDDEALVDSD